MYKNGLKKYYNSTHFKNINHNRRFCKIVEPFLSDVAFLSDEPFDLAVKNVDIKGPQMSDVNEDPIDIALNKYVDHLSKLKITEYFTEPTVFNLSEVIPDGINEEKNDLDTSKKGTCKNITRKSLKAAADVSSVIMRYMGRRNCTNRDFSKDLKNVDITAVFKRQTSFS